MGAMATLPVGDAAHLHDFLHDPVACLHRLRGIYGDAVCFRKDDAPTVVYFSPEHHREVFSHTDRFHISSGFPGPKRSAQRRVKHGLFGMNGDEHQEHRRRLMPPFRKDFLQGYHAPIVDFAERMLAGWRIGSVIDVHAEMKRFALRLSTKLFFGLDDEELANEIGGHFEAWLDCNHAISFASHMPVPTPTATYDELMDAAEGLENCLGRLIALRRSTPQVGDDPLGILLAACAAGCMTEAGVVGQAFTIFNAAYHTTTAALSWLLFLIAQHPETAMSLWRESRSTIGGTPPTIADLNRLPVLDLAIRESLRVLSPVVYYSRFTPQATTLGDHSLPAGTLLIGSIHETHRLPEFYPQPNSFLPDRWRNFTALPPAYLPFGGGSRMCLGSSFATMLVKIAVSMICQRFRLDCVAGSRIDREGTLTLGAKHGIPMRIYRADGRFQSTEIEGNIREMVDLGRAVPRRMAA